MFLLNEENEIYTTKIVYKIRLDHQGLNLGTKISSQKKLELSKENRPPQPKKLLCLRNVLVNLQREFMKHMIVIFLI